MPDANAKPKETLKGIPAYPPAGTWKRNITLITHDVECVKIKYGGIMKLHDGIDDVSICAPINLKGMVSADLPDCEVISAGTFPYFLCVHIQDVRPVFFWAFIGPNLGRNFSRPKIWAGKKICAEGPKFHSQMTTGNKKMECNSVHN